MGEVARDLDRKLRVSFRMEIKEANEVILLNVNQERSISLLEKSTFGSTGINMDDSQITRTKMVL